MLTGGHIPDHVHLCMNAGWCRWDSVEQHGGQDSAALIKRYLGSLLGQDVRRHHRICIAWTRN